VSIHEPRRATKDIRKLRTKVAEDATFASLVFDLRELMDEHEAAPNLMRAAVRLLLHEEAWRTYRRTLTEPHFEEEDVDDQLEP